MLVSPIKEPGEEAVVAEKSAASINETSHPIWSVTSSYAANDAGTKTN
jgi:hypothetical protein